MKSTEHSTDFTVCGTCSHSSTIVCGLRCDILPDITPKNGELAPESPCLIKRLGRQDLERAISIITKETQHHLKMIATCQARRALIGQFMQHATDIPILPDNRSHEHFEVGGAVVFYDIKAKMWRDTEVIQMNRGTVAFAYRQDREYGGGIGTPTILRKGEFDYFRAHPTAFKKWLYLSDRSYNDEWIPLDEMYDALVAYQDGET